VGPGFVGRPYDLELLRDLPREIDPCGEYGEFQAPVSSRQVCAEQAAISSLVGQSPDCSQTQVYSGRFSMMPSVDLTHRSGVVAS
jgi:hypothetical protein